MKLIGKMMQASGLVVMYIAGTFHFVQVESLTISIILIALWLIMTGRLIVGNSIYIKEKREENSIKNHRRLEAFSCKMTE